MPFLPPMSREQEVFGLRPSLLPPSRLLTALPSSLFPLLPSALDEAQHVIIVAAFSVCRPVAYYGG